MNGSYRGYLKTPLGTLEICAGDQGVTAVRYVETPGNTDEHPLVARCLTELGEYFSGRRRQFTLPLAIGGTGFRHAVWQALGDIPYGQTISYGELARRIGRPGAARAVGGANGKNVLNILLPCHRVIGADGSLVGYGSGLWRKQWLLEHERRFG